MINLGYDIEEEGDNFIAEDEYYEFDMPEEEAMPLTSDQPNRYDSKLDLTLMVKFDPTIKNTHGDDISWILDKCAQKGLIWKIEMKSQTSPLRVK